MDESIPETHGPQHHSYRPKLVILILVGLVGGTALYFGVEAWFFHAGRSRWRAPGLQRQRDEIVCRRNSLCQHCLGK